MMLLALVWLHWTGSCLGAEAAPGVRAHLDHGAVAEVTNLLTGETLTQPGQGRDPDSRVRVCSDRGELRDLRPGEDGASLETTAGTDGAEVVIRQTAAREAGGVAGVWLGLGPVEAEKVTLLIPGVGGVSLGPDSAVADATYYYPGSWGTPAVILQTAKGGVLVSADEPGSAFAALRVTRLRTAWRLALLTSADPPWVPRKTCASARWRFTAYRGPWTVAAARQRDKLIRAFGLVPRAQRNPRWADAIQCVVKVMGAGPPEAPLRALAREVEPARTLLYLPIWRTHPYDVMYPDYTPTPEALALIKLAQKLGFRVMVHGNLTGLSPFHPLVKEFRDTIEHDPATHALVGWYLDRDLPGQIYNLNPAFARVRKLLVDSFVAAHRQAGFDALHLDFPQIISSDTGPVEGLNPIQGTVRLLRELQAALPGVPLSTEGISDFMLDCSWAQLGEPYWNDNESLGRYHPIRAAIFSDFCNVYGHLGLPDQQAELQAYLSFIEVHDRTGCLPTFCLNLDLGLDPSAPGTQYALRQARFFVRNDPRPDYETVLRPVGVPGDQPALPYFAWRLPDGGRLAVVQTSGGRKWIARAPGGDWRELWCVYQGVREMTGPRHVRGWRAYSGERSFGLDPQAIYLPEEGAPDPQAFHLSAAGSPLRVTLSGSDPRRDVLRLEPVQADRVDLTAVRPDRTGTVVSGEERPLDNGGSFTVTSLVCGGVALRGIFAHPPWQFPSMARGEFSPAFRPASFGEFRLRLPNKPDLCFRVSLGLRDLPTPGTEAGDGVTFRVLVDGTQVLSRGYAKRAWEPVEVDLSPWRGKEVRLRLWTDVGPAGNPSFDWACWGEPEVFCRPTPGSTALELSQPDHTGALVVTDETGTRALDPGTTRVAVALPASVVYARQVAPVAGPGPLAEIKYQTCLTSGAALTPGSVWGSGTPSQWKAGDKLIPGINGHTPAWGQTHLEWLLHLPAQPLRLVFGAAIQPHGEHVGFSVQVNARTVWDGGDPGAGRLVDGSVDLSRWAGQVILLSLVTDSLGSNNCDWAIWVNPRVEAARGPSSLR